MRAVSIGVAGPILMDRGTLGSLAPLCVGCLFLKTGDGLLQMLDYSVIREAHKERLTMGDVRQIHSAIQKTIECASRCAQAETGDNYGILGDQVEELEGQAQEVFQSKIDAASLLSKLKEGEALTAADLKTLELLMVGDAEYFLKYETDFEQWKDEIKQLVGEISKLQSSELDIDGLMHLRALCAEVRRVLPAVVYYLDDKERVNRFREATQGPIDKEGRRVLTEMIVAMISSDKT